MTSLTQVAIQTRKVIRYSVLGIIAIIVARMLLIGGVRLYRYFFPAPPPPPTVAFGKLPSIKFPEGKSTSGISFSLETPEGGLPTDLPNQAPVYFMPKLSANLLSLDAAIEKANGLGFKSEPQVVSDTLYKFEGKNNPSTLEVNIITGVFSISYDLSQDSSPLERIPPASEIAASQVRSYLSTAEQLPEDLTGPTISQFLKIESGNLSPSLGQSDADLVKINFYRKAYNDLPSVTSTSTEANVWFMVTGSKERGKQIAFGEFHYFPVDETQGATYPLRPIEDAWQSVQAGNAYLASSSPPEKVTIRRIYLAYFDPDKPAEFYQPVYVFEGDGGFVSYVPAVTLEYYGE